MKKSWEHKLRATPRKHCNISHMLCYKFKRCVQNLENHQKKTWLYENDQAMCKYCQPLVDTANMHGLIDNDAARHLYHFYKRAIVQARQAGAPSMHQITTPLMHGRVVTPSICDAGCVSLLPSPAVVCYKETTGATLLQAPPTPTFPMIIFVGNKEDFIILFGDFCHTLFQDVLKQLSTRKC